MHRGYIKFWRKAQDSASWNRGLMYQGLIINLLMRAAWKKGGYQGRDILPGQIGTVLGKLADSFGVPKTTLHRMVFHLAEDGFLEVENVGNRFVVITITNWHIYQERKDEAWNAGGTPVEHQRNAGGTPSYNVEERKKEEDLITQGTTGNEGYAHKQNEPQGECSDFSDVPGIEFQEFRAFYDEHCRPEAPLAGFAEYKQLRAAKRWPGMGRLCDSITAHARADPEGWKKFCPGMVKFLREQWWDKQPTARASPQQPPGQIALSPAEVAKRKAEGERMLAALAAKARKENAELLQGGKGAWNLSVPSAQRQRSQEKQ